MYYYYNNEKYDIYMLNYDPNDYINLPNEKQYKSKVLCFRGVLCSRICSSLHWSRLFEDNIII